jgi:aspartyl-tRNA(Asn)/glutamyl-tRNA(Gln) amidotransferase subunit C
MPLTPQIVHHIADLARLELSEDEISLYCHQLSDILEYANRLQSIDTTGIPPTSSVLPGHTILRDDEARPGLSREELLKNAPHTEHNQFKVPPIFE